jgi:serine/threonine protein kinase
VVLKKIQMRYVEMTRVVKMFIDEGRIAQALEHPNIVRILDVGQEGGTYYIAMEYIAGRDLLNVCRRGVETNQFLPRHLAVAVIAHALRGLVHAHEHVDPAGKPLRVVHCDISPGNIVISWRGTAKIVDFGIARATIQLRKEDHSLAGKYQYMAPEQIRGDVVDARADLFAMGVILYEITVGKRLFRGRPDEVKEKVLHGAIVRPTEWDPTFPRALEAVIMKAIERDPARRYQAAREMLADVRAWLDDGQPAHGKRQIAEYMHELYYGESQARYEAAEFARDPDDPDDEDDELELEAPVVSAEKRVIVVDPEDEDPEEARRSISASTSTSTSTVAATFKSPSPSPSKSPSPSPSTAPSPPPAPSTSGGIWAGLIIVALALAVAMAIFFLRR